MTDTSLDFQLGPLARDVDQRLALWERDHVGRRLWERDHSVWTTSLVPELTDRLGWLTLHERMRADVPDLMRFAAEVHDDGIQRVVLLGMGGSSLAPEVLQHTFGHTPGWPRLDVLDSTHPSAVRGLDGQLDLDKSLFLVSSKSGTTIETVSLFKYFWHRLATRSRDPGHHFVAITDPGTTLENTAHERRFRRLFRATPDVGGRYSALTVFGLVPAALMGIDPGRLLDACAGMASACSLDVPPKRNPALVLGAALGELALAGRDKLTIFTSRPLTAFPTWIEQLVAESTGKSGKGIVPVTSEPAGHVSTYGTDRLFVFIELRSGRDTFAPIASELHAAGHPVIRILVASKEDLGGEFFRWEMATAAAGAVLGINPFDQPDVELAKDLARRAMRASGVDVADVAVRSSTAEGAPDWAEAVTSWLASAQPDDYIAVHAYLPPARTIDRWIQPLQRELRDRLGLAVTFGYGPRFLHSTGQLHKGGPATGLFLQIVDEPDEDVAVPEAHYTFGRLIRAQALGDLQALQQRGRMVIRLNLGRNLSAGLVRIEDAVTRALKRLR